MKIKLIAVGSNMPTWVNTGFKEYQKRLSVPLSLELIEIPLQKRGKNVDIPRLMQQEGEQMLKHIRSQDFVIALDVQGKTWSTEKLAENIDTWLMEYQTVCLLIGGPEGLAKKCFARANLKWSLSDLTLPHPLVRIIVSEQIYRAQSISLGHPYHR